MFGIRWKQDQPNYENCLKGSWLLSKRWVQRTLFIKPFVVFHVNTDVSCGENLFKDFEQRLYLMSYC